MSRSDWLGSALLCWLGAGLLALFLLWNPQAAILRERCGAFSLWGIVLGVASLGAALIAPRPAAWALPAGWFSLVLLPSSARWVGLPLLGVGLSGVLPLRRPPRSLPPTDSGRVLRRPRRPAFRSPRPFLGGPSRRERAPSARRRPKSRKRR